MLPYYTNIAGNLERLVEKIDSSFGYTKTRTVQSYTPYNTSYLYKLHGKDNISAIVDLFDELRGRWDTLWFPSWFEDFKLTADIGSSDTTLHVESSDDFGTLYPIINKTGNYIFIYINDNTWYARRITSWGTDDTIVIDSTLGVGYLKENIKFICFLYKGRLDIDSIEFNYKIPDVVEFELFFKELPFEYTSTSTTTTTTA